MTRSALQTLHGVTLLVIGSTHWFGDGVSSNTIGQPNLQARDARPPKRRAAPSVALRENAKTPRRQDAKNQPRCPLLRTVVIASRIYPERSGSGRPGQRRTNWNRALIRRCLQPAGWAIPEIFLRRKTTD